MAERTQTETPANLRITLSFRAEGGPLAHEALRAFLLAVVENQDLGTSVGVRDLQALGFRVDELADARVDSGDRICEEMAEEYGPGSDEWEALRLAASRIRGEE